MVGDRISVSREARAAVILQTHLVIAALDGGGEHVEQFSFQKHKQLIRSGHVSLREHFFLQQNGPTKAHKGCTCLLSFAHRLPFLRSPPYVVTPPSLF